MTNSSESKPSRFNWERVASMAVPQSQQSMFVGGDASSHQAFPHVGWRTARREWDVPPTFDYTRSTAINYAAATEYSNCSFGIYKDVRATRDFSYHGTYSRSRQLFQDSLVHDVVGASSRKEHPWIVFTAGAMGAGKSYTVNWMSEAGFFPLSDIVQIDPDTFKTEFPEWKEYCRRSPETAGSLTRKESGYLVEIAQEVAMMARKNVWVDGSLRDSVWYKSVLDKIRKDYPEYRVAILYVHAKEEHVLERARKRAEKTGRQVPIEEIKDSMYRVPRTVAQLMPHTDFVAHIENDAGQPRLTGFCDWNGCHRNLLGCWGEVKDRFATLPELREPSRWGSIVESNIAMPGVLLFSKTYCSYCLKAKDLLRCYKIPYTAVELDKIYGGAAMQLALASRPASRCSTVPQLFASGEFLGGCSDALVLHSRGLLEPRLRKAAAEALPGGEASLPLSVRGRAAAGQDSGVPEETFSTSRRRGSRSRRLLVRSLSG